MRGYAFELTPNKTCFDKLIKEVEGVTHVS